MAPFEGDELPAPRLDVAGTFTNADTVAVNGVAATLNGGGSYSVQLSLENLGSHTIEATASNEFGTAVASIHVTRVEGAPPIGITITAPADGAQIAADHALVTGDITDLLFGLGPVTVNGVPAAVHSDATGLHYQADIPLQPGPQPVVARVEDSDGDSATAMITVTRVTTGAHVRVVLAVPNWQLGFQGLAVASFDDYVAGLASAGYTPANFDVPPTQITLAGAFEQKFVLVFAESGGTASVQGTAAQPLVQAGFDQGALRPISELDSVLQTDLQGTLTAADVLPTDFTATHFAIFPIDVCSCQNESSHEVECPVFALVPPLDSHSNSQCPLAGPAHILGQV
ncbi:MAG TPA: hypothetical protein VLV15_01620, partial [Dongiaceae bacterium]|nr:hypothetical protein [Dongiaceae bacterium]